MEQHRLRGERLVSGVGRFRHRLAGNAVPEQGLRSLMNLAALALLDGLGVIAVYVICNAAIGAWTGRV